MIDAFEAKKLSDELADAHATLRRRQKTEDRLRGVYDSLFVGPAASAGEIENARKAWAVARDDTRRQDEYVKSLERRAMDSWV